MTTWKRNVVDLKPFLTELIDPSGKGTKNYLEVKHRLVLLRLIAPEARVETELCHFAPPRVEMRELTGRNGKYTKAVNVGGYALYKATVTLPDGTVGVGHKMETSEDFGDYAEKSETGAIGRAIAAAGIGIQYASEDHEYERDSHAPFLGVAADAPPFTTKPDAMVRRKTHNVTRIAPTHDEPPVDVTAVGGETSGPTLVMTPKDHALAELAKAADGPALLAMWARIEKAALADYDTIAAFLTKSAAFNILDSCWSRIVRADRNTPELGSVMITLKKQHPQPRRRASA